MLSHQQPWARPRVIYLGGFGRSGSTLLERMLGAVPGWVNVGELVDLPRSVQPDDEKCGCGEPFSSCPFWDKVGDQAFGGWQSAPVSRLAELRRTAARQRLVPGLLRLRRGGGSASLRRRVAEYQEGYGRVYQAIAEVSGATTIVDASKGPAHGLALGLDLTAGGGAEAGYRLTMVNLVRDPRGVAYSWSRRALDRPQAGSRSQMWSIGVGRSATQWAALQTEVALISRLSGIPSARIRYEDLVADPRPTLRHLLTTLGQDDDDAAIDHVADHAVTLGPSHGLSGNPGRFRHGTLDLVADDEWRRGLPAKERRLVTAVTLPWLRRYGYPSL